MSAIQSIRIQVEKVVDQQTYGRVVGIQGLLVEVAGAQNALSIGSRVNIQGHGDNIVPCEVIGFRDERALCMPFQSLEGVSMGALAEVSASSPAIYPTPEWLGRVVNAMGEPIDGKGPLPQGPVPYPIRRNPPPAHTRKRVGKRLDLGVRAINTFITCCRGQRMGIFAGSGVGKSVLMSMMARYTESDVSVIGLVGERGREVQEFIEDDLGAEGLARSVVIVATSDETALMRRQAAYLTMALSEYFRDCEQDVLCLMDSVTRFAMAQREIGLSAGEPPASKGYTPTVFSELPKLLERAGPGPANGTVTGLFTVLVEGDNHNEPVADAVRGILDGHIVMERKIAERGRFPAVNVLKSVSRTMPDCNEEAENQLITVAKALMSVYEDMSEMIRLGAYRHGSDGDVDQAIHYNPMLEQFLTQGKGDHTSIADCFGMLSHILQQAPHHVETPPGLVDPNAQ